MPLPIGDIVKRAATEREKVARLPAPLQALWALQVSRESGQDDLSPHDVSVVLREAGGVEMSRQKAQSILDELRPRVALRRVNRKRRYQIMQAGIEELRGAGSNVVLVQPERALTAIREVEGLLNELRGEMRVCDSYVDGKTLDFLAMSARVDSISVLTANIQKESRFRRDVTAFNSKHGGRLSVRRVDSRVLHDRYIIDETRLLPFGTSLNGLGKKQSLVTELGADVRDAVLAAYARMWSGAQPF